LEKIVRFNRRINRGFLLGATFFCSFIVLSCGEVVEPQRMSLNQLSSKLADAYLEAGKDSAGYDAMEGVARNYENGTVEIVGQIFWDRPVEKKPESQDKRSEDLTYGDLYVDSTNIKYNLDWLILEFSTETRPKIKPDLIDYGLDEKISDTLLYFYPGAYMVLPSNDTIWGFNKVVVRGRVSINWERGLRTRYEPLKSIMLKDCEIIEVLPPQ